MNAYIKFGEILPNGSQDIERNKIWAFIKGHNSGINFQKMTCNNPNIDLVNMNAYL